MEPDVMSALDGLILSVLRLLTAEHANYVDANHDAELELRIEDIMSAASDLTMAVENV